MRRMGAASGIAPRELLSRATATLNAPHLAARHAATSTPNATTRLLGGTHRGPARRIDSLLASGLLASRLTRPLVVILHLRGVLRNEIDRPRFQLGQDLADVFADDADHQELHAAE